MGRYTLTITDSPVKDFEKVDLREIDKYTMQFPSESDLLEKLGLTGRLWIHYKYNRRDKSLRVVYDDKSFLSKLSYLNKKININNVVFAEQIDNFLNKVLTEPEFYEFIKRSKLLNSIVKSSVDNYVSVNESADPNSSEDQREIKEKEQEIYSFLSEYLQFRNLLFVIEDYEAYVLKEEAIRLQQEAEELERRRIEEEQERHQEEFFTPEDYGNYKEYILTRNIPVPDSMKDKIDGLWEE